MAKYLLDLNLNIVTGGLNTAQLLADGKKLNIFIPGGNLFQDKYRNIFLIGDWYLRSLDGLMVDTAFVGIAGVDIEAGFTVNNALEYTLVHKIKEIARKVVVVADSTKFNHRAFTHVADLPYADVVVTNRDIPDIYREYFSKNNIALMTD